MSDNGSVLKPSPEQIEANRRADESAHGPWMYGKHDGNGNGRPNEFPWLAAYLHGVKEAK